MKKMFFCIFLLAVFSCSRQATSAENIRVALADNQKSVVLKSNTGLIVEGQVLNGQEKRRIFSPSSLGSRPMRVKSSGDLLQFNGRSYRGWIELRKKKNGLLLVINDLEIEDYLKGVVASEIPYDWEFEALKAQAIASRTYALYQKRESGNRPYHLVSTVNGQVYGGRSGERERAVQAVRETEGLVLAYDGVVIPAFYHASCGGHTENALELWGIDEPYLRGVDCDCQEISRYGLWEKRVSLENMASALGRLGYGLKGVTGVEIDGITAAGRARQLSIRDAGGITSIPAEKFRAALGYSQVPSVFFEVELAGEEVVISGRGLGHGVGLCQWGAKEMAQRGSDYRTILSHYYPGTTLMSLDSLGLKK